MKSLKHNIKIHPSLLNSLQRIYIAKNKVYNNVTNKGPQQLDHVFQDLNFYKNGKGSDVINKMNEIFGLQDYKHNSNINQLVNTNLIDATYLACRSELKVLETELGLIINCLKTKANQYEKQKRITRGVKIDSKGSSFFETYANSLEPFNSKIQSVVKLLEVIPLSSTIYSEELKEFTKNLKDNKLFDELKNEFKLETNFNSTSNRLERITEMRALKETSSVSNELSTVLMKFANDIRFVSSGPRSGFGEMSIPENEPGSSIMPGKVNPTQCESLTMVCSQVLGNSVAISIAFSSSLFEGNNFLPLISNNLVRSLVLLSDGIRSFRTNCLEGANFIVHQLEEELKNFKI